MDTSGNPIPSAKVYIYLAGTTTPAKVYSSLTGTTSASYRLTAADGTFFFYLDRFDYGTSQKFDFSVVKEGFYSTKRANVNVDSPVMGSYPITANKDITNYLYVPKGVTYAVAAGCTLSGLIDAGPYQIKTGDGILASSLLPNDRQWYGELNYTKFHIVEATEFVGESKMEWPLNSGLALYDETTGKWGPSVTDNSANWNNAALDAFKWDGGASGLNAETGRASLGLGSAALADASAFLPAAGISTPGYLIKWGDVPFEATDAIPLGTLLDGKYCTYSDLKGA